MISYLQTAAVRTFLPVIQLLNEYHYQLCGRIARLARSSQILLFNKNSQILDHPGRVTLKTKELFFFFCFSSTIREGDP